MLVSAVFIKQKYPIPRYLCSQGDWRTYFEEEKKAKELKRVPDKRRKILQPARRRASVCIADLNVIAKGLRSVAGSKETFKKQVVNIFGNKETQRLISTVGRRYTQAIKELQLHRRHIRKKERDSRDFRVFKLVVKEGKLVRREET